VRPAAAGDVRREPEEELARELDERLRDSIRAHLIADVPVGVMLSGGIDSGVLCALAAQESGARISTFSVGFEERSFDELQRARAVARRYGTDHHEVVVRPNAAELLVRLSEVFDEPLGDSSALPTYLVADLAAGHVKVALSGEGGDELFGGYHTYVADLLAARIGRPARLASPLVERLPSSSRRVSFDYMAKRFVRAAHLPPLEAHHGWKEIFSDEARAGLLRSPDDDWGAPSAAFDPLGVYRERWAHTAGAEPLARLQDLDLGVYLPSDLLVKTDRASMAHSLEVRVPYLDPVVAELALALPTSAKVRGWSKKRLLRRTAAALLPSENVHGRKRGFSIPAAAWLRGELLPFARDVLSPARLRDQGFLRPEAVAHVLERHAGGREDLSRQIWGLLTFTLWYDRWGRATR
jgi:asparagine synthase (glutamine-hydrolysing)